MVSGPSRRFAPCPLYPQKRTLVERVEMSALCQKQTSQASAQCPLYPQKRTYCRLPEAIADLVEPRLSARFIEIAAGRTTDADRGNGLVADLNA